MSAQCLSGGVFSGRRRHHPPRLLFDEDMPEPLSYEQLILSVVIPFPSFLKTLLQYDGLQIGALQTGSTKNHDFMSLCDHDGNKPHADAIYGHITH